ncbi:MAG TPA: hypothetical protein VKI64_01050 [Acidimicrobiales bacterium]|nr:hypothetical protein [Acidimicrobiales bacterium]
MLSTINDPAGDQGPDGPAYADLRTIRLYSVGSQVRVTVALGSALPARLPRDEVMGIGVDFFAGQTGESDYQLFAEGGPDGWYAYLQTPSGFVRYPGTFELGAGGLVFTVPASSLAALHDRRWSVFLDWSKSAAVTSSAAADHAPDQGRVPTGT